MIIFLCILLVVIFFVGFMICMSIDINTKKLGDVEAAIRRLKL